MKSLKILLLLAAVYCPAAALVYNVDFGAPNSFFLGQTSRSFFQTTGPLPSLNGSLNAEDQLQLVFTAPDGFLFSILPTPAGATAGGFFAQFATADVLNNSTEFFTGTVSFAGATSAPPVPSTQVLILGDGGNLAANVEFAHDNFSFKSITASFTLPQGYSRSFNNFTPPVVIFGAIYGSRTNLGPAAALIPDTSTPEVPEPATIFLVPGTLALLATRNFRQRCRPLVTRSH